MQALSRIALRLRVLGFVAAGHVVFGGASFAASAPPDIDQLFLPYSTDRVALAPDGKHVAFSYRQKETLQVVIFDVDKPRSPTRIAVADDAVRPMSADKNKTPVQLTFLRWATPNRLVFSANILFGRVANPRSTFSSWHVVEGAVFATNPDGKEARLLVGPDDVAFEPDGRPGSEEPPPPSIARSVRIIAAPPDEPNMIIVEGARGAGAPRTGRFKVNVDNGKLTPIDEIGWRGTLLYNALGDPRISDVPGDWREEFLHVPSPKQGGLARSLDKFIVTTPPLNFHITPENYLGERSFPLCFGYDPDLLYYASNVGRSTYAIFALDLARKTPTAFRARNDNVDLADLTQPFSADNLVFDRYRRELVGIRYLGLERATQWLDPELAYAQTEFNKKFPRDTVEILEWDQTRSRFLLLTSNGADPGRYYLYIRKEAKLVQFVERAPWLDPKQASPSTPFMFEPKPGVQITGYFTKPRMQRVTPPPLVVWCHDGPWDRDEPGFNPYVQIIANMGFAVLRVNYRGSAGFGSVHRDAIREGIDRIPLEDIVAAVDRMEKTKTFDPKRVALMGQGFGGYLAVRGLQLHPGKFRCAVGLDARLDLDRWVNEINAMSISSEGAATSEDASPFDDSSEESGPESGAVAVASGDRIDTRQQRAAMRAAMLRHFFGTDRERLRGMSAVVHADDTKQPVLFVQNALADDITAGSAKKIAASMKGREIPVEFLTTDEEFARGVPGARARVFREIEGFLNMYLYDYKVGLGAVKKVADEEPEEDLPGKKAKITAPKLDVEKAAPIKLDLPPLRLQTAEEKKPAPAPAK